jgi:hypothetical protein
MTAAALTPAAGHSWISSIELDALNKHDDRNLRMYLPVNGFHESHEEKREVWFGMRRRPGPARPKPILGFSAAFVFVSSAG